MDNKIKNGLYTVVWLILIGINSVNAAITTVDVNPGLKWNEQTADLVIQDWVVNVLSFLYIAAVLLGIWWGFNILTAAWDEEKVKKGKKILLQALGWIVIIFLAGSIVEWLLVLVIG